MSSKKRPASSISELRSTTSAERVTRSSARAKRVKAGFRTEAAELAAITAASERDLLAGVAVRAALRPLAHSADDAARVSAAHGAFLRHTLPYGGNGSLRPASLLRVLATMNLGPDSVFLDLGCGAGNVLLCALLAFGVRAAVGVEYDAPTIALGRSIVARQVAALAPSYRDAGRLQLLDADIARLNHAAWRKLDFDAVFAYDRVMNHRVLQNVARLMNALRPRVFATFVLPERWKEFGLAGTHFHTTHDCATTGNQKFTAYFFRF
jgi:SAM-dependent methyltransferase